MTDPSLAQQLAKLAAWWFRSARTDIRVRDHLGPMQVLRTEQPEMRGVLACALELVGPA